MKADRKAEHWAASLAERMVASSGAKRAVTMVGSSDEWKVAWMGDS
jgi:hypothetical protein